MSHRCSFTILLFVCGVIVLAGCKPAEPDLQLPTVVFGQTTPFPMNTLSPLDPIAVLPSETPPSDTPPNTAAPVAVNPVISMQEVPDTASPAVSAAPGTLIQSLTATPGESDPGGAVSVAWRTTGSTVSLRMLRADNLVLNAWEGLAQQGSITVTVPDSSRDSVGFLLTTESSGVTETSVITVNLRCPDVWFFTPSPQGCPADTAIKWQSVAQPFQHGVMLWIPVNVAFPANETNVIYVLMEDGGMAAMSDNWKAGMLEEDPAIVPPMGLLEPTRSFGLVWRDPGQTGFNVRDHLGWASGPEVLYEASYQCDSTPRNQTCYLMGPSSVLVIEPMSIGWHVWWGESVR